MLVPKNSYDKLSVLKNRHITLPTKFHLVKFMVFLVVMYGYDSWTIKKAEGERIHAFEFIVLEKKKSLEQQGDQTSQS